MNDPLDDVDADSEETIIPLPPPPPGIDMPLPEIPPAPPDASTPQFGFVPEPSADGDLLDAANSLTENSPMKTTEQASDFKSVWDKRKTTNPSISSDSRDSIYNRIDRISTGRGESLMDRYADRFGSDLDREIIVLRKKDQDDLASIKPTVELISEVSKTEMSFDEFIEAMDDSDFVGRVAVKTGVSVEKIDELDLESMKEFFESADKDNSGSLDFDEFVNGIIQSFRTYDEDFAHFFTVVNGLLGQLPDEKTVAFISSDGFKLFETVGNDPNSIDTQSRGEFFTMVNELLVDLPDSVMKSFTESNDFDLYKLIASRYGG
ncbi:MAG: hypothetical protein QGF32_05420 [Candidatus Thalassarchaeaceae archaeon]|nr:hypothetical protein [Candidatus Thalassarchaeaceae archaeon]